MSEEKPLFEQVSEETLRAAVRDFYDRVFGDVMIGYLFSGKDKERLIEKELELWWMTLGAPVPYTGKSMHGAHLGLRIMRGMFDRRLVILRDALDAHDIPGPVKQKLLDHSEKLRKLIITESKECVEGDE